MSKTKTAWYSSYEQNNYGELFYSLVRIYQPDKVVELGTRAGYSAYHIAKALKENGHGSLDCYDLFEENVEHIGLNISQSEVKKNLQPFKEIVKLNLADAIGVDKNYPAVDILHVDLDNDAEILEKVLPFWIDKVKQIIIIEGGSSERDQAAAATDSKKLSVENWLNDLIGSQAKSLKKSLKKDLAQFVVVSGKQEYKEKPIGPWLKSFSRRFNIEYFTIEPFPSLTILRKK